MTPPNRWWTKLPVATNPDPTDVCSVCGHVRSLHRLVTWGVWACSAASKCGCGPMPFQFHIAGWDGTPDTVTVNGNRFTISQPRAPSTGMPGIHD